MSRIGRAADINQIAIRVRFAAFGALAFTEIRAKPTAPKSPERVTYLHEWVVPTELARQNPAPPVPSPLSELSTPSKPAGFSPLSAESLASAPGLPCAPDPVEATFADLRRGILRTVIVALLGLGLVATVPSVVLAWISGRRDVVAFDAVMLIVVSSLYLNRNRSYVRVSVVTISVLAALSLFFVVQFGPGFAGMLFLMATPILTAILLGMRGGLVALGFVVVFLVAIGALLVNGALHWVEPTAEMQVARWTIVGTSLLFAGGSLTIAIGVLLRGLEQAMHRERKLGHERARLEQQLLQQQKMEVVGILAGGIAHDLNNLLVPVLSYAGVIANSLPEGSPNRHDADQLVRAALRARDLVRRVLTFARVREAERKPVFVKPAIDEALALVRPMLGAGASLELDLDGCEGAAVHADPIELQIIVLNICTNAVHALADRAGLIQVKLSARDSFFRIGISDTGPGIPADIQERIFEPFFTTKALGKGTGLGLSTVRAIVEGLGGRIELESAVGTGTDFSVLLPACSLEPRASSRRMVAAQAQTSAHVLLVEDQPEVRRALVRQLRQLGMTVTEADGAPAALERVASAQYDVVLSDLSMPGMSGVELARELVKREFTAPVVILTGEVVDDRAEAPGPVARYLHKPVGHEELRTALLDAIAKQ